MQAALISPIPLFPKTLTLTLTSSLSVPSKRSNFSPSPLVEFSPKTPSYVSRFNGLADRHFCKRNGWGVIFSALDGWNSGIESETQHLRKRKIVEHIFLLKAKEDLSDEEEKEMLDYLYTAQYLMGGIVAISLGRIVDVNADGFTHAVYMRFQRKEDLAKFHKISSTGVLKEHVKPYCHGLISVDYESEVEDDILPIFRKGEDFNHGVEFILLISVIESAFGKPVEDALDTLTNLIAQFGSLVVQATQGANINPNEREYTHAVVIRFPTLEALNIFRDSSEYKNMWRLKFQPIAAKSLSVYFAVDPVGTEIM
ncbi:hypothetical protein MRB53_032572 [Persea americana]|uniref:Uncharacterized protein n=1 Tax=Persea americana TaxID=3435 RepID=A0ACC2KS98_PERAE|nr:hypothetical protein MRB53_032572 [Persea americana]|eukprot:TRINITY_DN33126_c0_g1_i4.p1 TRINITY_DN33126_c0_g1~~TRINITY_DN33126_c0_g1_i4.p1  ORF type:complete len:312 (+),score=61.86 TRINITY_DN33126_c0_g1_i4:96-1031(+)